jgi:hypothetical protein
MPSQDEVRTGSYMEAIDSSQVDVDGGKQPWISCGFPDKWICVDI